MAGQTEVATVIVMIVIIVRGDQQVLHEVAEVLPGDQQSGLLPGGEARRVYDGLHLGPQAETEPGGYSGQI